MTAGEVLLATLAAMSGMGLGFVVLVLVWAFVGIAVNYSNLTGVLIASIAAALIVVVLAILAAVRGAWPSKAYAV